MNTKIIFSKIKSFALKVNIKIYIENKKIKLPNNEEIKIISEFIDVKPIKNIFQKHILGKF